ncbi:MAG TPA: hypothetical protein VKA48_01720, partial [Gammaproteobacteria bacterium]|nr:hypothetical protein [Gammaproteobacteria bacterium]
MDTTSTKERKLLALAALGVFVISLGAYLHTLGHGFVYDDRAQVLENPWIRDPAYIREILTLPSWAFVTKEGNFYRPVMHLVYMAEYHVFGLSPWGYHLVNVVLHSANALLVFVLARLVLTGGAGPVKPGAGHPVLLPFLAGLLFALHPVNTEVANWVAAIPELTMTLSVVSSFCLYVIASRSEGRAVPLYAASLALYFVALLSKETGIVLVLLIVAWEVVRGRGIIGRWRSLAGYPVVAAVYMAVRMKVLSGAGLDRGAGPELYENILNVPPLLARYAGKLMVPVDLKVMYP